MHPLICSLKIDDLVIAHSLKISIVRLNALSYKTASKLVFRIRIFYYANPDADPGPNFSPFGSGSGGEGGGGVTQPTESRA